MKKFFLLFLLVACSTKTLNNESSNVDLKLFDGDTQIPTMMNIFMQLTVMQNPDRQKMKFTTNNFISGQAYKQGFI